MSDSDPRVWARGKTAEELLNLSGQLYNTVESVVNTGRPPAQPQQTNYQNQNGYYQPPTQPPPQQGIADDAYVTGADFNRVAPQYVQQHVDPQLAAMQRDIGATNLEMVKRDPRYASVFAKYGPEVYNKLASVDKKYWNVDNLGTIVNLVKADHVEDIANEIASRRLSELEPTFRSTGAASAPVSSREPELTLKSERLPADYRERLAKVNMTESALNEFLRAAYPNLDVEDARKEFFAMAEKTGGIITEGSRRG